MIEDDDGKNREKIDLGIKGENLAEEYLINQGYTIVARNERIGHSDIDILAREENMLVFVEVRTKSDGNRGMPEETLNTKKLRRMRKTAELYITLKHYEGEARLDAVCIIMKENGQISHFKHYKGV